ncbi:diguanylate cyclase [Halodesulfovibrio marinisediminis]|uniref:PAS domain S-box-containing protein/diguanylate cyclase (GGDEF) domain-containing protein n=1 Tax=Halodesulfovibrio marinisediminis DSM 17456 TaxID=1121457 RepID=A0A1N6FKL0_9BACT|nr:diguanylate cyclase [Halodesulfovibrio marinisediminis]SIN95784.1 PAS domain S-box-containing protein/diguanylate cyclase (GGDEF) domain-containing protein [Halodesulfovibrio marinisediminis DSM 17456]
MNQIFYQTLLNSVTDGIYFVDASRRITYWNKAAERLSGYTEDEVMGKVCSSNLLRHEDENGCSLCDKGCPLSATLDDGEKRHINTYMRHKLGHRIPITIQATPIFNSSGSIIGAVEVFAENSESLNMRREMELLRKEVLTDELTGIGNRRYAEITMRNLDHAMEQNLAPFGILFIDIDDFKSVNDTYGHQIGDKVLRMVAQTLTKSLRFLDVICRWGGEEFVIFVPNTTINNLTVMAERLRRLVERSWLMHEKQKISVTASFGGAISQRNEYSFAVLTRADRKLYHCKNAGRNRIFIDKPEEEKVFCSTV